MAGQRGNPAETATPDESPFRRPTTRDVKLQLTEAEGGLLLAPCFAGVAQLVEHHLAKVDVESSSLFARSILFKPRRPHTVPGLFHF